MKDILVTFLLVILYSRFFKILPALFLCFILLSVSIYAEDADPFSLSLIVNIMTPDKVENPVLKDLIQDNISIELERAGIIVIPVNQDEYSEVYPDADIYLSDIFKKYGTPGILECHVKEKEELYKFELVLHILGRPELTTRTVKEEEIDLSVDQVIAEAVADILRQVGDFPVVEKKIIHDEKLAVSDSADEDKQEPEADEEMVESEGLSDEPVYPDNSFGHLRVSTGGAPFLAIGSLNYYFNVGMLITVQGGYRFDTEIGDIEAGLSLGVLYFEALGLQSASNNFIIPLGASGRWITGFDEGPEVFITIAGGPALFMMQISDTESLFKVTGFVSAGGGVGISVSDIFGITAEVDYTLFFEEYYPIMGIVPSIYFDISF